MAQADQSPGVPGSLSAAEMLKGVFDRAIRESVGELSRAGDKRRGVLSLDIDISYGDYGEVLGVDWSLFFRERLHHRNPHPRGARESTDGS